MSSPLVQVAVDTISLDRANELVDLATASGADWIEIGKPLVEFEGLNGVRDLVSRLQGHYVLLDLMIMAAPEKYLLAAKDMGASNVTVTALAPQDTVAEAIAVGKRLGIHVTVDLFNTTDTVAQAKTYAALGADFVMVHFGVDQKRNQPTGAPIDLLAQVVKAVDVPVSYASYDLEESIAAVHAGASVIVQGEPILSHPNAREILRDFIIETKRANSGVQS